MAIRVRSSSQELFQALLDLNPHPTLISQNGIVVKCNQAMGNLYDTSKDSIISTPLSTQLPEKVFAYFFDFLESQGETSPPRPLSCRVQHLSSVWIQYKMQAVRSPEGTYIFTTLKQGQRITQTVHELRNQLSQAHSLSTHLLDRPEEFPKYQGSLHRSLEGALEIAQQHLYARKPTTKQRRQKREHPFNLQLLMRDLKYAFSQHKKVKKEEIAFQTLYTESMMNLHLCGNALLLRQILTNLLRNAFEHTTCRVITLQTHLLEKRSESVLIHFSVSDTGVGIAPEMVEACLRKTPFHGLVVSGNGVGLKMCDDLIQKLGGQLSVESKQDKGSTFSFTLNFTISREEKTEEIATSPLTTKVYQISLQVLIVEDSPSIGMTMKNQIMKNQHSCTHVKSGAAAVTLCQRQVFDLIFMDYDLGAGIDGIETTRQIRLKGLHQPNIIMLTGTPPDDRSRLDRVNIKRVIIKPLPYRILKQILTEVAQECTVAATIEGVASKKFKCFDSAS